MLPGVHILVRTEKVQNTNKSRQSGWAEKGCMNLGGRRETARKLGERHPDTFPFLPMLPSTET